MGGGSDVFEMGMGGIIPAMFNKKSNPAGTGGTPGLEGLFTGGTPTPSTGATPSPVGGVPPAGGAMPPMRQLPGFSGPGGSVPLFGRMSPEQLAAYNAANGITLPKPPPMPAPKSTKPSGLFKRKPDPYQDDGRGP